MQKTPRVLTIAGSDSGSGAGIQADLKTFEALKVYGTTAITAVTAQNTLGIFGVGRIRPSLIQAQIDAVLGDIGADAVKTGMLPTRSIVEAVAACLRRWGVEHLVVDPVMFSTSGERLMEARARRSVADLLFPLAELITPNIPEAEALIGRRLRTRKDLEFAGRWLLKLGPRAVLIKGGHGEEGRFVTDLLFVGRKTIEISSLRIRAGTTHGTGCTLSAAIAANLAKGDGLESACRKAKAFVTGAIRKSLTLGGGQRLLNHHHLGRTGGAGHQ